MISLGRYLLLIALVFSASLFAQTQQSPNQLLTQVGDQLFSEIGKINSQGTASKSDMAHIVDQYLMPNIDVKFVSYKFRNKRR